MGLDDCKENSSIKNLPAQQEHRQELIRHMKSISAGAGSILGDEFAVFPGWTEKTRQNAHLYEISL
jgi:hypothetical protein